MADIQPYTVEFNDDRISKLKHRLNETIFPDELEDSGWDLGSPLADVQRLAKYWRDGFDFRSAAAWLNSYPNFTTKIQCEGFEELSIHFVHVKSEKPGAIPLLFSHGWPGNFMEGYKLVKPLIEGNGDVAFHIVIPSLPNYGFSEGTARRGFAFEQLAETCHQLMLRLGYNHYVTQGGDWGWFVTRTASLLFPDSCLATHFNFDVADPPEELVKARPGDDWPMPDNPSKREIEGAKRTEWFKQEGFGYNLLQGTKPQTLAYALNDSPVALLSWIYEKLHDWTDEYPWTDDEILTWISIYWFSTAKPGASVRIYYEANHDRKGKTVPANSMGDDVDSPRAKAPKVTRKWLKTDHKTGVKIGYSHFPKDVYILPTVWTNTLGEVVFDVDHERGGHFAAWEKPDIIASDLQKMFASGAPAREYWVQKTSQ